jgi:hypothetical protein
MPASERFTMNNEEMKKINTPQKVTFRAIPRDEVLQHNGNVFANAVHP